ncbi:MAG: DNA-directed RNA polymerase subunit H [Candidatus Micrarchaeales archaeon]|nr:DNA-directed RNA polymerase subunit H [Candidatus Micrarchaeales archaeon]
MAAPRELIPEHELVSESDVKKLVKEYNIPLEKFPKIVASDVQVQKLGAKPGQLVRIKRRDPTGNYVYYRYVVQG